MDPRPSGSLTATELRPDPATSAAPPSAVAPSTSAAAVRSSAARSSAARSSAGLPLGLLACLPLLGIAGALAAAGWRPVGDEAIIALRSWDQLAGNGPLVGQFTQASVVGGEPVFSPGPLLYWVLAVPTHLSPTFGPAAGALAFSALAVVLACLAAGRAAGRLGAVGVAAGALVVQATVSAQVAGAPVWNPDAGLLPFAAVLVLGWVVAGGRLGWLPALVVLASFCVQTHLMFAPAAVVAVVAAVFGWLATPDRPHALRRVLPTAGLALALCWAAALWQQVTGPHGNVSALLRSTVGNDDPVLGLRAGTALLARSVAPDAPLWLTDTAPRLPDAFYVALLLAALLALGLRASRSGNRLLLAAVAVCLAANAGAVWVVSSVVVEREGTIVYIQHLLWPTGVFTWGVLFGGLLVVLRDRLTRMPARMPMPVLVPMTATVAVAAVVLLAVQYVRTPDYELRAGSRSTVTTSSAALVTLLGSPREPGQRIAIAVPPSLSFEQESLRMATVFRLRTLGWSPAVEAPLCRQLVADYCRRPGDPVLTLTPLDGTAEGNRVAELAAPAHSGQDRYSVWWRP